MLALKSHSVALGLAGFLLLTGTAEAAEIRVVSSGGFAAAYTALSSEFQRATGNTVVSSWGPSMGDTKDTIPARLRRGEPIDVVLMVGYALDGLIKQGKVIPGSRVDLARSGIGVAVRAGAPQPDVTTVDALRRTLLAAKSIAYSDSASGVYIQNEMFKRLGIADQVAGKSRMIPAEPVGGVVARGEAEIGFQAISELKPIAGITLLGPLAPEMQQVTLFSAGIVAGAKEPEAARALISYLASPAAAAVIIRSGMEPALATAAEDNPMSAWLRAAYMRNASNLVRTAEKMPDEFYDLRPGAQQEVRTFGQQVGHVASYNFLWCSQAKGEKNPNTVNLEKLGTKAEYIKALNDAVAYCDGVYAALTDASGAQMIDITQESGRQTRNLRLGLLTLNYAHNNEIYGSMVSYLRMNNIVPPASEPRPQQQK